MSLSGKISPWSLAALAFVAALFLVAPFLARAQVIDEEMEREAQAIDKMIMCPVCPAETIDQAQVEISFQMRAVVREMLVQGRSREEILDYFVDRYGADILAAPPKSGANLLAWILPIAGVAAALVGVFFVIRAMTGRQRPGPTAATAGGPPSVPPTATDVGPELASYIEIADRLIASRRSGRSGPASGDDTSIAQDNATPTENDGPHSRTPREQPDG